jgi:N-acetylglutamate synthase-like GNAT family acetyltransferase
MNTTVSIRKARSTDAGGIVECLHTAFAPYEQQYTPEAFRDTTLTAETATRRLSEMTVFVAVDAAGEVVGTIACAVVGGDEGHLRGMAVRPDWQASGVADRLLETVEDELRRRGCSRVTLDTTVPLQRAVRFYTRHGFRRSGRPAADFFGMPLFEYVKTLN